MERSEIKPFIAKRVAKEIHDGDVVNLGIGLPTMVPDYVDPSIKITLQSEERIHRPGSCRSRFSGRSLYCKRRRPAGRY